MADGRKWGYLKDQLVHADQQVGFREMLENSTWSNSPFSRMSTGAKHLHGDRSAYLSACKRLAPFSARLPNYSRRIL